MADPVRQAPLDAITARGARLAVLPPCARFVLRGRPPAIAAAGAGFGATLPLAACTSVRAGPRAALWLGPDEYLLLAPAEDADAMTAALRAALAGEPHALVDVSHRQIALDVAGPAAARLLNAACPLDLSLAASPVGMCTRTVFAKAEIVLWRRAADTFYLEVARSFAGYVWRLLEVAQRDAAALAAVGGT
jgi:sarcosine oxidase subunit gamma